MSSSYAITVEEHRCDECGAGMAFPLFCDSCGVDYPERSRMSAFGLLGLNRTFAIAEVEFDRREILLAQRLHPDKWMSRSDRLHRKAVLAQSAVNEALEAVRDPFRRAETLLNLTDEQRSGSLDAAGKRLPPGFLVEQLELQEAVQDGLDDTSRKTLTKQARRELKRLQAELADTFAELDVSTTAADPKAARTATVERIAGTVSQSRYWRNIQAAVRGDSIPE
jgi:molecular chaperone HscB